MTRNQFFLSGIPPSSLRQPFPPIILESRASSSGASPWRYSWSRTLHHIEWVLLLCRWPLFSFHCHHHCLLCCCCWQQHSHVFDCHHPHSFAPKPFDSSSFSSLPPVPPPSLSAEHVTNTIFSWMLFHLAIIPWCSSCCCCCCHLVGKKAREVSSSWHISAIGILLDDLA